MQRSFSSPDPPRGFDSRDVLLERAESMLPRQELPALPPMRPERAEALMAKARRLEEAGECRAAAATLRRAAKAPSHTGVALSEMARIERKRGRTQDAMSLYKQALHDLTDRARMAWVYSELGQLYFAQREDDEARYYFRRAARIDARYAALLDPTRPERPVPEPLHELETADIELVTLQ